MVNEDLQEPLQDLSVRPTQRTALRLPRRSDVVACVSGVFAFGLAWGQHHWHVPHPLLLFPLRAMMTSVAAVSLAMDSEGAFSVPGVSAIRFGVHVHGGNFPRGYLIPLLPRWRPPEADGGSTPTSA